MMNKINNDLPVSIFKTENGNGLLQAFGLLKILSNIHRLSIVCLLSEYELSVNELADLVELNQSTLSQHLSILKKANLVKIRRDHNKLYYSLSSQEVETVINTLKGLYCTDMIKNSTNKK